MSKDRLAEIALAVKFINCTEPPSAAVAEIFDDMQWLVDEVFRARKIEDKVIAWKRGSFEENPQVIQQDLELAETLDANPRPGS